MTAAHQQNAKTNSSNLMTPSPAFTHKGVPEICRIRKRNFKVVLLNNPSCFRAPKNPPPLPPPCFDLSKPIFHHTPKRNKRKKAFNKHNYSPLCLGYGLA